MSLYPLDVSAAAPWRAYFRAPQIAWTTLATQNPARGLVCCNRDGAYQLYAWEVPQGTLTRLTAAPTGQVHGAISAAGDWVYYLQDEQGGGIGHYWRVPFGGGPPEDLTPDWPAYTSFYIGESYDGQFLGFMTANQYGFQMFVRDTASGGTPHLRYEAATLGLGPFLAHNGDLTVIAAAAEMGFTLEAYATHSGQAVGVLAPQPGERLHPVGFSQRRADGRFLALSELAGSARPLLWDVRAGTRQRLDWVELPGRLAVWDWSRDGAHLLLCQTWQAEQRLYLANLHQRALKALAHPPGAYDFGYFSPRGTVYVQQQTSAQPARLVELGGLTGELRAEVLRVGDAPPGQAAQALWLPGAAGTPLHVWLLTPPGDPPWPLVVHLHGDPDEARLDMYAPEAQTWAAHGIAWCSVTYQASALGADRSLPGTQDVAAVAAAVRALIAQGIAQAGACLVMGGAYGGTLALLALNRYPDLFAGGMALAAMADWTLFYEDAPETLRAAQVALFGGTPVAAPAAYAAATPDPAALHRPLLILQGEDDPRCPPRQMQTFIARLHALGQPTEAHWYSGTPQAEAHMAHLLAFAARVLA